MKSESEIIDLKVDGMTCSGCASSIETLLKRNKLDDVHVNFIDGTVHFSKDSKADIKKIIEGINQLGYKVRDVNEPKASFQLSLGVKLIIASLFTLPLLFTHILPHTFGILHNPLIQFLLAIPPMFIGFWTFLPGAVKSSLKGMPNMDVTICLGALAALIYSLIGWYRNDPAMMFFETGASILTLVLLGKYIEHKAVQKTTSSIDELKKLTVEYGKMQMPSGTIVKIPIHEINKGDLLLVAEGDAIPLDGKIVNGSGQINEAIITGESTPVLKQKGDEVMGSTMLLSGNLTIQITHIGNETILGKIIELVKKATSNKAPIQSYADKISAIFVPLILVISIVTFSLNFWVFNVDLNHSIMRAIAVLVISCPCAMGLATPTAIMVGLGKATRKGILIKGAATLETLGNVSNLILDKTGTITEPQAIVHYNKMNDVSETKNMIYAIQSNSSHPIAKAVLRYIGQDVTKVFGLNINEIKGKGISALDQNKNSWLIAWADTSGLIDVTKNDVVVAQIELTDKLKEGAKELIEYLQQNNIQPVLLSGDAEHKVSSAARELHISEFKSRVMPDQKSAFVLQMKSRGITAMAGDGINDAIALSNADIGISFSDASNIAMQSSQVVLINNKLNTIATALKIGRQTLLTIKQNLAWAFSYNIIAIPLAAMGYLNPAWGALFMAFSDLVVIGNSLRINYKNN